VLDIAANRKAIKYSKGELIRRLAWSVGQFLFRCSPRPCFGWRRFILRCFGARIGKHVNTYASTRIYFPWNLAVGDWSALGEGVLLYNPGQITLGEKVTISPGAHLCAGTHDYRDPEMRLLKPPIRIEDQAWVCADAFIAPGIVVGEGAVVGARSVVTKNVEPWTVVAGNPAKPIGKRELAEAG
jgi:putative colanic acid biosynthesis acetyltransferase WcaF